MDFMRNILGGSQRDHDDFANRYHQGPRAVSDQEAAARYQQVAPNLPPDVYQESARDVFAQMTPQQRAQFGQQLIQSAREQGHEFPDVNRDGIDDRLQDPDYLARTTTQMHQQQPGLLGQLFGGAGGGHVAGNPLGGVLGGGGAGGGMMSSPLAKGVLGGIAAYGVSRMVGGGHHHRSHHGHGGFFGFEGPEFEGPELEMGADDMIEGDFGEVDFGGEE